MRSRKRDKGKGTLDVAKGRIKEAVSVLRGDKARRAEGRIDRARGAAKWTKGRLKDFLK